MTIVNHTMPVVVAILSAALLSMSLIVYNIPLAEARHADKVNQQQSGKQQSATTHPQKGDRQAHGKNAVMNQRIAQSDQCTKDATCWNYAENILCVHATCIFGSVTPFLIPWQKEIVH